MKTVCVFAIVTAIGSSHAFADEFSAWSAVESATNHASSSTGRLAATDEGHLGAIGTTLDLSLQYMDGLVNGGKQRDTNIEAMIASAFSTVGSALQADHNAAGGFEAAFQQLQVAAAGLEVGSFQLAEDAANGASTQIFSTEDYLMQYSADLMMLEYSNSDLSVYIQLWLSGGPPMP